MALYGTKSVSQAAAIALRQLQDQLSAAYSDIAKLQQERSDMRRDMHELAEVHNSEQQHSEAHTATLSQQISEMRNMLEEMKGALETTAEENAKITEQLEQSKHSCTHLAKELSTSRSAAFFPSLYFCSSKHIFCWPNSTGSLPYALAVLTCDYKATA